MSLPGGTELLLILAVVMLLFGAKKLPELARSMGRAGKEFKAGTQESDAEKVIDGSCPFCEAVIPVDSKFCPGCARSAEDVEARRVPLKNAS